MVISKAQLSLADPITLTASFKLSLFDNNLTRFFYLARFQPCSRLFFAAVNNDNPTLNNPNLLYTQVVTLEI
jgi:hypothetical protein